MSAGFLDPAPTYCGAESLKAALSGSSPTLNPLPVCGVIAVSLCRGCICGCLGDNSDMAEDAGAPHYDVAELSDHVEVRGVTGNDVFEALRLLDTVRGLQATQVSDKRDDLVRALMTSNIRLTPPASVAQAH